MSIHMNAGIWSSVSWNSKQEHMMQMGKHPNPLNNCLSSKQHLTGTYGSLHGRFQPLHKHKPWWGTFYKVINEVVHSFPVRIIWSNTQMLLHPPAPLQNLAKPDVMGILFYFFFFLMPRSPNLICGSGLKLGPLSNLIIFRRQVILSNS